MPYEQGGRGSILEELINRTNELYHLHNLALVQKIPTPITPMRIDPGTGRIKDAFFEQKSTVDYIGAVQGIPVCFDAKECAADTFPLKNVHAHQLRFMEDFEKQGGISFLIVSFVRRELYYYMRLSELKGYFGRMEQGGRKSFVLAELDREYFITRKPGVPIPYLDALSKDLENREDQ